MKGRWEAVVEAGSALSEGARSLLGADVNKEAKETAINTLALASQIQSELVKLHSESVDLKLKNAELERRILAHEDRAEKRQKYEPKKLGQCWLMALKTADEPYYCPSCFDENRFIPLQAEGSAPYPQAECLVCSKCSVKYWT